MSRLHALVALSVLLAAPGARAIIFNDGMVHVIDAGNSFPTEDVIVRDGPGGTTTTVQLVDGGVGRNILAEENSVARMLGGELAGSLVGRGSSRSIVLAGTTQGGLFTEDHAIMDVLGGAFGDSANGIGASGGVLNFRGGTTHGTAAAVGGGTVNVSGGRIVSGLLVGTDGTINVNGGVVEADSRATGPSAVLQIYDGGMTSVGSQDGAVVNIFGGSIVGELRAQRPGFVASDEPAELNVFGGLVGSELRVEDDSAVSIFGSDFNMPLGHVAALVGNLSGSFLDGTPFSLDFTRDPTATITLVQSIPALPIPAVALLAALLLATGLVGLGVSRDELEADEPTRQ